MSRQLPDPAARHPILLPDGTPHAGTVHLAQVIDHPNIEVGDYSYYSSFDQIEDYAAAIAPYLYPGAPEYLRIGRFCQIAHGMTFITSSANHPMGGLSTFPFAVFNPATMGAYRAETAAHGDTVVGNDVWLGFESVVMPGVRIGHGAIVAARAVVTRDVPDYAIVAGNPGRVVRLRFPDKTIDRLLELRWWEAPEAVIKACVSPLEAGDIDALENALRK